MIHSQELTAFLLFSQYYETNILGLNKYDVSCKLIVLAVYQIGCQKFSEFLIFLKNPSLSERIRQSNEKDVPELFKNSQEIILSRQKSMISACLPAVFLL